MRWHEIIGETILREAHDITVYHGTSSVIDRFEPNRDRQGRISDDARGCLSFSTDKAFAASYAGKGGYVYTVRLSPDRLGDFRSAEDCARCLEWHQDRFRRSREKLKEARPDVWTDDAIAADYARQKFETMIPDGAYQVWENVRMWAELGWDGAWMIEQAAFGPKSLNVSVSQSDHIEIIGVDTVA